MLVEGWKAFKVTKATIVLEYFLPWLVTNRLRLPAPLTPPRTATIAATDAPERGAEIEDAAGLEGAEADEGEGGGERGRGEGEGEGKGGRRECPRGGPTAEEVETEAIDAQVCSLNSHAHPRAHIYTRARSLSLCCAVSVALSLMHTHTRLTCVPFLSMPLSLSLSLSLLFRG